MIAPEPTSFQDLMKQLTAERFGTVREVRRERAKRPSDQPPRVIAERRRVLAEALADEDGKPLPNRRRAVA